MTITAAPIKTFGAVPQSIRRSETRNCSSIGSQQQEVQVACAHQLGKLVAVLEEEHLDQAVHREEAADEEEVVCGSDQPATLLVRAKTVR